MRLLERFSVKKLYDDLEYWIFIGIGDDIVELKSQRPEYKHLVDLFRDYPQETPQLVLGTLREELKQPVLFRKTFWHLVKLNFLRLLRRV